MASGRLFEENIEYSDSDSDLEEDERVEKRERSNLLRKLFKAIRGGDTYTIRIVLNAGTDVVNGKDKTTGWSPLHIAARVGNTSVGESLLKRGADIDCADSKSWTALTHAVATGQMAFVKLLLERGADLQRKDEFSLSTALHWAALQNHCEIIKTLMDEGANPNAIDKRGFNPMTLAAANGKTKSVQLFLRYQCAVVDKFKDCKRVKATLQKATTLNLTDSIRSSGAVSTKKIGGMGSLMDIVLSHQSGASARGGVLGGA